MSYRLLIFGELPTGIISDRFGARFSLVCALICAIAGMFGYVWGSDFFSYLIAEFLCAISLCFWSGSFESFSMELIKDPSRFFHLNSSVNSFAILVLGGLGGWLGTQSLEWPYYFGALFLSIALLVVFAIPKGSRNERKENPASSPVANVSTLLRMLLTHRALWPLMMMSVAIQFAIQPILHYWQPFFQAPPSSLNAAELGLFFSVYCAFQCAANACYYKWNNHVTGSLKTRLGIMLGAAAIFYVSLCFVGSSPLNLMLFCALQGCLTVGRTILSSQLVSMAPRDHRATFLSVNGLLSRCGMLLSLGLIGAFSKNGLMVRDLYFVYGVMGLAFVGLFTIWFLYPARLSNMSGAVIK